MNGWVAWGHTERNILTKNPCSLLYQQQAYVSVLQPYQLSKLHLTISLSSCENRNGKKAESRESEENRVHKRPHASSLTIGQRYVLEIPLISDPSSRAPGSVSQLSGATGEKRAGLTLMAPESSGSVINDWSTFTVSTVSQTLTDQTNDSQVSLKRTTTPGN